jgi:hypothetical protein
LDLGEGWWVEKVPRLGGVLPNIFSKLNYNLFFPLICLILDFDLLRSFESHYHLYFDLKKQATQLLVKKKKREKQ